jgi:AI-2 transport protein TqsA
MDQTSRTSLLILAVATVVFALVWLKDILSPFALAVFLWLIMDAFAGSMQARLKFPRWLALSLAILLVFAGAAVIVAVVTDAAAEFIERGDGYEWRINQVVGDLGLMLGITNPPTIGEFLRTQDLNPWSIINRARIALQAAASNALFVFIYVGFLFAAQASFPKKLDAVFADQEGRARAARVLGGIRISMERYLWVQTLMSIITSVLSYITLALIGIDNPLFWSFLIFLLNYIPTIGSVIATALPTLFALVQFPSLWQPLAVFIGVGAWQFLIGNFLQPRMQGENLNLATIVVLLGLAVWGAIWGVIGMFLSSPLTVMVMILCAQFSSTRWVAVMLSADGRPETALPKEKTGPTPTM